VTDTTTPALSLVICTRNRSDRLRRCLDAVAAIRSTERWEVVVVDNGSTDDTHSIVEEAAERFPVPLRLVAESMPGVSRARNTGWRTATAALVAYTDDDCYPQDDYVDVVLARFAADPRLGVLGGAVLPYDPTDAPVTYVAVRDSVELPPGGFVTPGLLISANLAFRRNVLEQIGGFDTVFGYGAGFASGKADAVIEDVDAVARVLAAGWRGRYDPAVVVRHHHGRKPGPEVDAIRRGYDIGRGAFFAKCALDGRMRRKYLAGWMRLTAGRVQRREPLGPVGRELWGAAHYLRGRVR
jgi:glycosyltransferase involved in cell wall biosynthesis